MYPLYKALANRVEELLKAETPLIQDSLTGSTRLSVSDSDLFNWRSLNLTNNDVLIFDDDSTGVPTEDGFEGYEANFIQNVFENEIILVNGVSRDWLASKNAIIQRAPGGKILKDVFIGDREVISNYPSISIVPSSKSFDWQFLSGTRDTVRVDFIVYADDYKSETATEVQLKLTDALEHILNTNLHIQPLGATKEYQRTSKAFVTNINYATIEKGSEFIKASQITWEAELHTWRAYLTSQGYHEAPLDGPHNNPNY